MPNLLVHCLLGVACAAGASLALGLPPFAPPVFLGGLVAMVVDLDSIEAGRSHRHPKRTLLLAAVAAAGAAAILLALHVTSATVAQVLLASNLGIFSHAVADAERPRRSFARRKARREDDPYVNALVGPPCLAAVVLLLALAP